MKAEGVSRPHLVFEALRSARRSDPTLCDVIQRASQKRGYTVRGWMLNVGCSMFSQLNFPFTLPSLAWERLLQSVRRRVGLPNWMDEALRSARPSDPTLRDVIQRAPQKRGYTFEVGC